MNIVTNITAIVIFLSIFQGCSTNNSTNIRDTDEGEIRKSKNYYTLMRASEASMVKAKNVVLDSSTDFCKAKGKILLPVSTNLGIETGWVSKRQSYQLDFSCVDASRVNPWIGQVTEIVTPPNGKSGLYLLRDDSFLGFSILYDIKIDGMEVGTLSTKSFLYGQVTPGNHSLSIKIQGEARVLNITTHLNKNLYVTMGPGWSDVSVDEIEESRAKNLLTTYTHSMDNMFKDKLKF